MMPIALMNETLPNYDNASPGGVPANVRSLRGIANLCASCRGVSGLGDWGDPASLPGASDITRSSSALFGPLSVNQIAAYVAEVAKTDPDAAAQYILNFAALPDRVLSGLGSLGRRMVIASGAVAAHPEAYGLEGLGFLKRLVRGAANIVGKVAPIVAPVAMAAGLPVVAIAAGAAGQVAARVGNRQRAPLAVPNYAGGDVAVIPGDVPGAASVASGDGTVDLITQLIQSFSRVLGRDKAETLRPASGGGGGYGGLVVRAQEENLLDSADQDRPLLREISFLRDEIRSSRKPDPPPPGGGGGGGGAMQAAGGTSTPGWLIPALIGVGALALFAGRR